jgi:hypothetical protein
MKLVAYAISRNEEHNVAEWAAALAECDQLVLADTGSTDDTVGLAEASGAEVHRIDIQPWHFANARNQALSFVPYDADYCFVVDLDERPEPGWREKFEDQVSRAGDPPIWLYYGTRVWGDLRYQRMFLHRRDGCYWRRPVHEELSWTRAIAPTPGYCDLVVHHHQDAAKSRSNYLALMALGTREDPGDTQLAFWYARELMYAGRDDDATCEFERFIDLPQAWVVEVAQANIYLAEIAERHQHYATAELHLSQATTLAPWRREPMIAVARFHTRLAEHSQATDWVRAALNIPPDQKTQDYLTDVSAWDDRSLRKEFGLVY